MRGRSAAAALCALFLVGLGAQAQEGAPLPAGTGPRHGMAMHGPPALPEGFEHFPWADPNAVKGGEIVLAESGTFDSLNPYIIKGTAPVLLRDLATARLMEQNPDEPFAVYGFIAQTIEVPEDRSWVEFRLDPRARFSDGTPVTVEDVVFTMELLRSKDAQPNTRNYYSRIARVERPGEGRVRFVFAPENTDRELALILARMPVLSKAWYETHPFGDTSLEPPPTAAPYRVVKVDPGRSLTFERVPDYWGTDLPALTGRYNFDLIRVDYYRDNNASFEAFKAGAFDILRDKDMARWSRGYDFPAMRKGVVERKAFVTGRASGMSAIAMNTRRPLLSDIRVRKALVQLFDFDWMNVNFFDGAYSRTTSYFDNSDLAAHGPASAAERDLLAPFMDEIDPAVLEEGWLPPAGNDPSARLDNLLAAKRLFEEAGYVVEGGRMVAKATKRPVAFEMLFNNPDHERLALTYADALKRLGILARPRRVDTSQFNRRWRTHDYDLVFWEWWTGTLSPGNEQRLRWSSGVSEVEGSINLPGIRSPGIDAMIDRLTASRTREELVAATRALDRLLLSGYYVIPLYHTNADNFAWVAGLRFPEKVPLTGERFDAWWWADGRGRARHR